MIVQYTSCRRVGGEGPIKRDGAHRRQTPRRHRGPRRAHGAAGRPSPARTRTGPGRDAAARIPAAPAQHDRPWTRPRPPTIKQHLAAIRRLCDWLVTGQVITHQPGHLRARADPRRPDGQDKTPVLQPAEARQLLDTIDTSTLRGLRDRALLAVMVYSFALVSAVVGMLVEDYYQQGKRWWLRLQEKGGKHHAVPVHHKVKAYLDAVGIAAE